MVTCGVQLHMKVALPWMNSDVNVSEKYCTPLYGQDINTDNQIT